MKGPAIGTLVAVTWLDSGAMYFRSSKEKKLARFTGYGVIIDEDKESITMAHEYEEGNESDTDQMTISVIAKNCIEKCVELREKGKK